MTYEFRGNTHLEGRVASRSDAPTASTTATAPAADRDRSIAQVLAAVFGATFLLVGILGFVPGVTSHYGDLSLFGTDSHAELLGLFRVSVLHNVVHLLFGVGLLAAARPRTAVLYLLGGGAAYAAVVAYGFVIDKGSDANFLPVNQADNLLHVALTAAMILAGAAALAVDRRAATA